MDETLSHLDVLAEVAVAARLTGDSERALSVVKRALRIVEELDHPLRAAWFWTQKAKMMRYVARGTGWDELDRAQRLLAGHEPSPTHAHVLTEAATWAVLFDAGPRGCGPRNRPRNWPGRWATRRPNCTPWSAGAG